MSQVHEFSSGGYVVHRVWCGGGKASVWLDADCRVLDVEYFTKSGRVHHIARNGPMWKHVAYMARHAVAQVLNRRALAMA